MREDLWAEAKGLITAGATMNKFYLVWTTGGGNVHHPTKDAARKEAAHLTTKRKGEVYVLEAIEVVSPVYDVTITPLQDPK